MSDQKARYTLRAVPPELEAEMGAAAASGDPEAMAEAAFALLERVIEGSGGREVALPLLAADALLTQAFETLARHAPHRLAEAADRWGAAGRLGSLAGGAVEDA
jgi:hypothetical protein